MTGIIAKIFSKIGLQRDRLEDSAAYSVFRIIVAFNFFTHGAQKLLGAFGGTSTPVAEFGLLWFAGIIELIGGALIALGLFTRLAALFPVASMFYAYFFVHGAQGLFPILNRGELALIYFASFLLILFGGSGRWSVDRLFWGRDIF